MSKKSKNVFFHVYRRFRRKESKLSDSAKTQIRTCLKSLEDALLASDKEASKRHALRAKQLYDEHLRKKGLEQFIDLIVGLAVALAVAVVVRQIWFELYEIPTGSMRPTLKEQDRLIVSKTNFGLNIPLMANHAYFDPTLVQRYGIVTLTSENMDIADADTRYFYIFPGKKQFVKRMIGKPGDILYFYGGDIYGIDANGQDISAEFRDPQLALIDHIPFLRFEGQLSYPVGATGGIYPKAVIHQMGQPIAVLNGTNDGKFLSLASIHDNQFPLPESYSALWGIGNYAMARLLTKEEAIAEGVAPATQAKLFLELSHHPRLGRLELTSDISGKLRPGFRYEISLLPLNDQDIKTLFSNLYTARFSVKSGLISRYSVGGHEAMPLQLVPRISDVPDGLYEFYYGKAYQIGWQGLATELPNSHPIYQQTPERLLLWFNLGLDFNNLYKPSSRVNIRPNRYAYFRDGDLFVMGQPLWKKGDTSLAAFEQQEQKHAKDYIPFVDCGPPNHAMIQQLGLKIPEKSYLVLGDNHAMSGDSRVFGFVPEDNLRGAPSFIFWPAGSRWGIPNQPPYPWFTLPNISIWVLFLIVCAIWRWIHVRRMKLPVPGL